MPTFTKRPEVIEAVQLSANSLKGNAVPLWFSEAVAAQDIRQDGDGFIVATPRGKRSAAAGDYVVQTLEYGLEVHDADAFEAAHVVADASVIDIAIKAEASAVK